MAENMSAFQFGCQVRDVRDEVAPHNRGAMHPLD